MKKSILIIAALALLAAGAAGIINANTGAPVQTLKQQDEAAKVKYQQAREQYQKEVNFYKNARQDLLNARSKYQKAKNAENKKDYEDTARKFLEKTISSLIKRLEAIKNWVANRQSLPEDERQAIIAEIDQDIVWLNEQLPGIPEASATQIKEKAKTMREYWKNHRAKVKRVIGQIWAARVNFVIGKAENLSAKVGSKIDELKAAGNDTAQLEAWLADFNNKIALAKEKYEAAKTKFRAISNVAEADQLFREGHQFIKDANQYVIQAHNQLKNIVREMKKMGKTIETPPDDEASTTEQ